MSTLRCNLGTGAGGVLALTLAVMACGGPGHSQTGAVASGEECRPVTGRIPADAPWDSLPGSWRLTLVATSGTTAGKSVQGAMSLHALESALRQVDRPGYAPVMVPVIGATDVALEQVGAVRLGDLHSTDPNQPGLAIWVSQGPDGAVSAIMRIGQEAIHSDLMRIDGGYTALYLGLVSANAIRGGWASGVNRQQASGYFCAQRVPA